MLDLSLLIKKNEDSANFSAIKTFQHLLTTAMLEFL